MQELPAGDGTAIGKLTIEETGETDAGHVEGQVMKVTIESVDREEPMVTTDEVATPIVSTHQNEHVGAEPFEQDQME